MDTNNTQNERPVHPQMNSGSVTFFTEQNRKTISLVSSALVVLGFFLPWINIPRIPGAGIFGGLGPEQPSITGLYCITELGKLQGGASLSGLLGILMLLCIPVFGGIFFYTRLNSGFENKIIGTISVSLLGFLPIQWFIYYILTTDIIKKFVPISDGFSLGIGMIFMVLGTLYLYYDTYLSLNQIKTGRETFNKIWQTSGMFGGGMVIAYLLFFYSFDSLKPSGGVTAFLILGIFVTGVILSIKRHKDEDLRGWLSYDRAIGVGLLTSAICGLGLYFATVIFVGSKVPFNLPASALFIFTILFSLLGFIVSSIAGRFMENFYYITTQTEEDNTIMKTEEVNKEEVKATQENIQNEQVIPQSQTFQRPNIAPTKPFSEQIAPITEWFKENRKMAIIGGSSLLVLFLGYKLFIETTPEGDGRKASKVECSCKTESNKSHIAAYEEFLKGYDSFGIKTREDAQKKLQEIVEKHTKESSTCQEKAKAKYNSLKEKYILQSEEVSKFESAYYAQQGVCTVEKDAERFNISAEVEKKIGSSVEMTQEEILNSIKTRYNHIFTNCSNNKYAKSEYKTKCDELGKIIYYTENGKIMRIDETKGSITYNTTNEYYFEEGRLFFVLSTMKALSAKTQNDEESRYYFDKNKAILCKGKYREGDNLSTSPNTEIIPCDENVANGIMKRSNTLKEFFSTKLFDSLNCDD